MFKSKQPVISPTTDYSGTLRETSFYKYGHLRTLGVTGEITALAVDPVLSLLAVGTSAGVVHVFGQASFQFSLPVSVPLPLLERKADGIKFIAFHPGHARLVVVDDGSTIHQFALNHISEDPNPNAHPPLPTREASSTVYGTITAFEQPLPSYTHMFFTMKDGVTLAWDLRQHAQSTYKIQNMWAKHEERLVRSGVPGRHRTIGGQQATCTAMNPRDLNILLIGYESGVVAWDFRAKDMVKIFEMTLPPGAPGGGSYHDETLWTERTPAVTTITWRPDGQVFAVGHADGCIAFWAYDDAEKPLLVRTLTHEDVNVADAESLMEAGALGGSRLGSSSTREIEGMPVIDSRPKAVNAQREAIYKLTWVGFPDGVGLKAIMAEATTRVPPPPPLLNATVEYSERNETLLTVLGGQNAGEKPGINILQFPPYHPPVLVKGVVRKPSNAEGMPLVERSAYRDSLAPTGASNYSTKTPPEDFVLLPRSSPYFGMAHDPIAIFIMLTPDLAMPRPEGTPMAARPLEAFTFPPPRSNVVPPVLGRKNFATPGEGEDLVALTPAPRGPGSPSLERATGGWRFPWTSSSASSSQTSLGSTLSGLSGAGERRLRRRLRMPSLLMSGGLSVLGCKVLPLPTATFKLVIKHMIESADNEAIPRVPLHGGLAVPDLQSHGAPDLNVVKMENYRLLCTWHADATVRFWDISPHLLVLPTPLRFEYPSPLPHLTISIGELLRSPSLSHLPLAKLWKTDRAKVQIASVHVARESMECVIAFKTGEVVVYKFDVANPERVRGREAEPDEAEEHAPAERSDPSNNDADWVEEVTDIVHLARWRTDGFKPVAVFSIRRGEVTSCAISDIGFIAVAFTTNSLAIFDMRGPDVILREGFNEEGKTMKRRKRKGNVQNFGSENSPVRTMKWAICGVGGDTLERPRLIVSYAKGLTKIYGLSSVLGEWMVEDKPATFSNDSLADPLSNFVLDIESGTELTASPDALAEALASNETDGGKVSKEAPPHCLWIATSKHAIRVTVNFNGERVAKAEFEEELSDVHYITRHGKRIIVAVTTTGTAIVYSAPHLEFITRIDLFSGGALRPIGQLSFDDRSGDFVEYMNPLDITLRTLFHFRKPCPPRIDPCALKQPVPAQPQPLTATYLGWMWGSGPLTGSQLDGLVGGATRPQPPPPPPAPRRPLITWGEPPPKPKPVLPTTTAKPGPKRPSVQQQAARPPRADMRERKDAYSELQQNLGLRGDYLDVLGESLDSAASAAANFRDAALKSTAKSAIKSRFF